jgi:regulator of protease activity HflC (stomatin/prohibitin superfamily)
MLLALSALFVVLGVYSKKIMELVGLGEFNYPAKILSLLIALALAILSTVNVVAPGTNQVTILFGKANPEPLPSGVHFINPLVDTVEFNLRQTTEDIQNISLQTQDRLSSDIDISVTVSAKPETTPMMYVESGTLVQAVDKHLTPAIRSIVREVGRSVLEAQSLVNADTQNKIQDEIESKLNEYLAPKGFVIHAVMIRDIELPQVVKQAVIATKERQEAIEKEKAQLKVIEQQSMQQIVQAESKAKAAEQNAIAIKTMADAEAYRILAEAKATADGNKEISKSLTREVIDYKQAERWDGKLPTTSLGSATPMISVK